MLFAAYLAGVAAARAGVHIAHAIAVSIGERVHGGLDSELLWLHQPA
jgi:alcohol dehydrogenase class IV